MPEPTVTKQDKCERFKAQVTELDNGRAIAILAAPCDGTVSAYACFMSQLNGAKPALASLAGSVNGVSLGSPHDYDFNDATLTLGPRTIDVTKGATITFDTQRSNSSAKTTRWEMQLEFSPAK